MTNVFEIFKTSRGNEILSYNGYQYTKNRDNASTRIWRCIKRGECTPLVKTSLQYLSLDTLNFKSISSHSNHLNNNYDEIKIKKFDEMKKEIIRGRITTDEVIYEAFDGFTVEAARHVGSIENLKRMLRRARSNALNSQPYYNEALKLSKKLCFYKDEKFLQYGSGNI